MVSRRGIDAEHPAYHGGGYGVDGQAQCRRCLGDMPPGRSMFCSDACEHEFRIRVSPAYARAAVYRRDRGVCAHCRLDCGMLDRVIRRLRQGDPAMVGDGLDDDERGDGIREQVVDEEGEQAAVALIAALGLGSRKKPCSLWQVDHRVPFSTGGADCGLGNLRTLCLACHQVQTKALHRGLKAERDVRG